MIIVREIHNIQIPNDENSLICGLEISVQIRKINDVKELTHRSPAR